MRDCPFYGSVKAMLELMRAEMAEMKTFRESLSYTQSRLDRQVTIFDDFTVACDRMEQVIKENKRPDIVTARKLSEDVGVSPHTIVRWYKEGRIRGFRMSDRGTVYFDRDQALEDIKHIAPEEVQAEKGEES